MGDPDKRFISQQLTPCVVQMSPALSVLNWTNTDVCTTQTMEGAVNRQVRCFFLFPHTLCNVDCKWSGMREEDSYLSSSSVDGVGQKLSTPDDEIVRRDAQITKTRSI